jgi:transposase
MVTGVWVDAEQIEIQVESKVRAKHCPACGATSQKVNQTYQRRIRDLPISRREVSLLLTSRQFECRPCGRLFYEQFEFVAEYGQLTNRYEYRVYQRCIGADFQYVAVKEDLCWRVVQRIFTKYSTQALQTLDPWCQVRALGIDEIALKKGHNAYAWVLVNLETGQLIDILDNRSKERLIAYFQQLDPQVRKQIEYYSSDMWDGYITVGRMMFPNALLVVDRFHFFGHMQAAVDRCRKQLRRRFPHDNRLKQIKWLLLKNKDELSDDQLATLRDVFALPDFEPLKHVYTAKNSLRDVFEESLDPHDAAARLSQWEAKVRAFQNRLLNTFLTFFQRWKPYVLNSFYERFSTGPVEGTNNRLRALLRRAFGFLNFDHFRRRALIEAADLH